jgi:hypothetical protein
MKVSEALRITQAAPKEAVSVRVLLGGFSPLRLQTFLTAHLQVELSGRRVIVSAGLDGNLSGTIERATERVIIEWADLDPPLDFRDSSSWGEIFDLACGASSPQGVH